MMQPTYAAANETSPNLVKTISQDDKSDTLTCQRSLQILWNPHANQALRHDFRCAFLQKQRIKTALIWGGAGGF
jgi:hypothetical protein